jgi:Cu+-exporting ATPase
MGELKVTTLGIQGFHCSGCANNLSTGLSLIEGVIRAKADFDRAEVEVRFDPARVTDDDIRDGIRAAGFEPV